MSRNYFIVLKDFNKYCEVHDKNGVDMTFLSGRPLFAKSEDTKTFLVRNFGLDFIGSFSSDIKISADCVETAFEVGEESESAFIDDNGFEVPIIDDSKKLNAVLHLNIGIERRCMIKSISYNSFYAADGFKFSKSQGKVFMNSNEAYETIKKIMCEDKNDLLIVDA